MQKKKPAPDVPVSLEAEEHVVGACLLGGSSVVERASAVVSSDEFYRQSLGAIFSACVSVTKSGADPDPVTVGAELRRTGEIDDIGGYSKLVELMSQTSSTANVAHHARIVRETAYAREQFYVGQQLVSVSTNGGLSTHPELMQRLGLLMLPRFDGARQLEKVDLDELLAGPVPVIPWTWDEWIGEHTLVVVAGAPGAGKSYLMLALALHIIRGEPFLGGETRQGRCGVVDLENPKSVVHQRLHALGLRTGGTDGLAYIHMPDLSLATRDGIAAIDATVVENELDFLVLDSFRRLCPGVDENDSAQVSAVLNPVKAITQARGCTIVIIHHARKRGDAPNDAGEMIRGSGDFSGGADITMFLRRKSGEPGAFTLEHGKNRLGLDHIPILARIVKQQDGSTEIEYEGDVATTDDMVESLLDRVVTVLRERSRFTLRADVKSAIGVTSQRDDQLMSRALKLGVQRNVLTQRKSGRTHEFILTTDDLALDAESDRERDSFDESSEFPF